MKRFIALLSTFALTTSMVFAADIFNLTDTWNNGGTDFDAFKMVVTDTASGADSDFMDWSATTGGIFKVLKTGELTMTATIFMAEQAAAGADVAGYGQFFIKNTTPNEAYFVDDAGTEFQLGIGLAGALLADGTIPLTADWDAGAFTFTGTRFISDIATGTAPFGAASTTVVPNLNVSFLEGNAASAFATAAQGTTADNAIQKDGSVALTANWDAGSFDITAEQFHSDIVTGTSPLTVASTTVVANLNADLLDGNEATAFATAAQGTLADNSLQKDGSVELTANWDVGPFSMNLDHTAALDNAHMLELHMDAAGFGGVETLDIDYDTGAMAPGDDEAAIVVNINELDATGGDIFGLEVLATEGSAAAYGIKAGANVGPILQESGTFANPTTGTNDTPSTDVPAMIDGSVGTNTTIFVADDDYILIGAAAAFTEIEFVIETGAANPGVQPTFGYSITGSHLFTTFSPIDGTDGFRHTGVVAWDANDLTSHAVNTDTGTFDIKITRTHASAGSVSLFYAKSAATVVYSIDKDGVYTGNTLEATGDTAAGDNAAMGYTATEGLVLTGQGSTYDIVLKNDADANVIQIPTGTTTAQLPSLTASEIVITDATQGLVSAAVATYPSLTELTYVKGVTSAIQTQIDAATTAANYGSMYDEGNADVYVINAQTDFHSYHTNGLAVGPEVDNWTFDAGGGGTSFPIASIADGAASGVDIEVTTTGSHLLAVGDVVSQTNLTSAVYTGIFLVKAIISATQYEVLAVFTATDTGTMDQAATLDCESGCDGKYSVNWSASAMGVSADESFDYKMYKNATAIAGSGAQRKFGPAGDVGAWGSHMPHQSFVNGDKVSLAVSNGDSAANFTFVHLTIVAEEL